MRLLLTASLLMLALVPAAAASLGPGASAADDCNFVTVATQAPYVIIDLNCLPDLVQCPVVVISTTAPFVMVHPECLP